MTTLAIKMFSSPSVVPAFSTSAPLSHSRIQLFSSQSQRRFEDKLEWDSKDLEISIAILSCDCTLADMSRIDESTIEDLVEKYPYTKTRWGVDATKATRVTIP